MSTLFKVSQSVAIFNNRSCGHKRGSGSKSEAELRDDDEVSNVLRSVFSVIRTQTVKQREREREREGDERREGREREKGNRNRRKRLVGRSRAEFSASR